MFYHKNYTIPFDSTFLASILGIGVFLPKTKLRFSLVAYRKHSL